jgi:hypothetical protein
MKYISYKYERFNNNHKIYELHQLKSILISKDFFFYFFFYFFFSDKISENDDTFYLLCLTMYIKIKILMSHVLTIQCKYIYNVNFL